MKLADFKRLPSGTMLHRVKTLMGPCSTFVTVSRMQSNGMWFTVGHKPGETWLEFPKAKEFRAEGNDIFILVGGWVADEEEGEEVAIHYKLVTPEQKASGLFWTGWVDSVVSDVTTDAWRRLMKDTTLKLYLYHRKGCLTALSEMDKVPEGFERSIPEALPGETRAQLYMWLRDQAGRIPFLPER